MFASLILSAALLTAPVPKPTRPECDAVLEILAERACEPELRRGAVEQMGLLRYRKAAKLIRPYLTDASLDIRIQAVAALIACDGADEDCATAAGKIRDTVFNSKTTETTAELDPIFLACTKYPNEAKPLAEFIFASIRERQHYSGSSGLYEAYRELAAYSPAEIAALLKLCRELTWPCQDQNDYRLVAALAEILSESPKCPAEGKTELERWLAVKEFGLEMQCARSLLAKDPAHAKALDAIRRCTLRMAEDKQLSSFLPWCHSVTRRDGRLYADIGGLAFSDRFDAFPIDYFWKCLGAQGTNAKQFLPAFKKRSESKVAAERYAAITAMIQIDPALYDKYLTAILDDLESADEIDSFPAALALIAVARPDPKLCARLLKELNRRATDRHSTERLASVIAKLDPENEELAKWIRKRLNSGPEENANPNIRQWNRLPELLGDLGPRALAFAPDLLKLVPDAKSVLPNTAVVQAIGKITHSEK